ncbi:iron-siderophore ABC transporter substrate-binding protein [Actinotalea sp. JY-7885]|uniref:ABC transporter substrate-binding protein n=1 Tax=Actinotalea sp. JY-7885 TaxID=2758576 RepID=UPI00165D7E5A|nr:iron-siderophore ABC transporter substrate-binding protein [Actinotalea sp. JY-7885]
MRRLRLSLPALTALAVVSLAACGTTEAPATETDQDSGAVAAAEPITVMDERGEVTLDAPAQRVVSLEWGLTENLLSLGVEPIGAADPAGYNTWATVVPLDEATPDVGFRGEPSLDAIAALEPDLVVTTTDLPENVVAQIEESFPVIALRGSDASDPLGHLRETVTVLGEVTGTSDEAQELLAEFDTAVEEGAAALAEAGLEGAPITMADGWDNNGVVSIRMYTEGAYLGAIAAELGLENAWTGEGDADYGLASTDVEGLTGLGDVHFLYAASDSQADPFAEGLAGNPIWEQLPFVTAGDVHRIPDGIWMFGGPASGEAFVDAVVDALTE